MSVRVPGREYASRPPKYPSATVWPNKEFGLGFTTRELAECSDITNLPEVLEPKGPSACELSLGYYREAFERQANPPSLDGCLESTHALPKGITSYGQHMVRSGAYLLERCLLKGDVAFLTLTVPPLDAEARRTLALNWGKLTNRLVQQLSRCLQRAGRKPTLIGVTEIQSGRLSRYSEGYLHLHIAHPKFSKGGTALAVDVKEIRAWWKQAIERFAGSTDIADPICWATTVEKSVEGYLGKYLSKGSAESMKGFVEDLGADATPAQWWFCSAPMREAIKGKTVKGEFVGEVLTYLIAYHRRHEDSGLFSYLERVSSEPEGKGFTVGWYGKLTDVGADTVRKLVSAKRQHAAPMPFHE